MRTLARRIGFYLLTAVAAVTVDFLIPRVIPGNPLDAVLAHTQGQVITKATLRALEVQFGTHSKTGQWGQYLHYWSNLAHGNLGVSTSEGMVPVTTVIRGALPWTLGLVGTATVLSFILGTLLGILIAWVVWVAKPGTAPVIAARLRPLTTLFENKWYFDELIDALVVRPSAWFGSFAQGTFERLFVNGALIGGTTAVVRAGSAAVRSAESGFVRYYVGFIVIGLTAVGLYFLIQT